MDPGKSDDRQRSIATTRIVVHLLAREAIDQFTPLALVLGVALPLVLKDFEEVLWFFPE